VAKRTTATRQKAESTPRRSSATRKPATSGRSGTKTGRSNGSTRRRSTIGAEGQSGRREPDGELGLGQADARAQDVETAQPEATRGAPGERVIPSRRRSSDEGRLGQTSSRALAEDAEGDGGREGSVGRERQDDEIDERVMREGSNPRAASEARER